MLVNRIRRVSLTTAIVLALLAGALPGLAQNTVTVEPASLAIFAQFGSGAPLTRTLEVSSSGTAGTSVNFFAGVSTQSGGAWLSVNPQSGTTPATLTVTVTSASLQPGTYQGTVTVSIAGANATVPVILSVGPIGALPAQLAFSYQEGGTVPGGQSVSITGTAGLGFTAAASTTGGGNWLQVAPVEGATPATLSVTLAEAVLATLTAGTYQGAVTVTPTGAVQVPTTIPVTLTVSAAPRLNITPTQLTFGYQNGGTNNVINQPLHLSSTVGQLDFFATVTTQGGGNWLVVDSSQGTTPATLTVWIQAPASPGTYNGTVTINAPEAANPTQQVPVTLTVSNNPLLSLTPSTLSFTHQIGTAAPAAQTLTPQSTGAALNYTVTAATSAGGNWLVVNTAAGATPAPISISVNPAGLAAGAYNGTVTVTAEGAGNPPRQVPVTLTVSNDPLITVNSTTAPATVPFIYQTGKVPPGSRSLAIGSSTGAPLDYTLAAATEAGGNWLSVTPATGTTPGNFTISVNPAGVVAGNYDGSITITATNPATGAAAPNSPLSVPVRFFVNGNALLSVSEYGIALSSVAGTVTPQSLSVTSTSEQEQLNFQVSSTTISGGPSWLVVGPQSGTTPLAINVSAVPGSLAPGNYAGSISITATNPAGPLVANSPVTVPVNLAVAAGSMQVSPASLAFTMPAGGSAPAQNLSISSTGGVLNFSAAATTESGGAWLSVNPASGATPGQIAVSVSGASLAQGVYHGAIAITAPGAANSPQTVQVTLTVGAPVNLQVSPSGPLTFNHLVGSQAPAAQTLNLSSSGASLNFTVTTGTTGGGQWLSVTPAAGSTPAALSVSVNPAGIQAGTYNGTITIASPGAANSPRTVAVALVVTAVPPPSLTAITSGASWSTGLIAPGEIVAIWGSNLGPQTLTELELTPQGRVATTLAETQVLFDNVAAPLLYTSANQVGVVVPYELHGRVTTRVQVRYRGTTSAELEMRLADSRPGIFTASQTGTGPGAILNWKDGVYSINSPQNPAARGSAVVIYATGEGQTDPGGVSGKVMPGTLEGQTRALLPVTVTIGGKQITPFYAGSAPNYVAGVFQVNVFIPDDAPIGQAVPVVVTVGGASSQAGVTLAVKAAE